MPATIHDIITSSQSVGAFTPEEAKALCAAASASIESLLTLDAWELLLERLGATLGTAAFAEAAESCLRFCALFLTGLSGDGVCGSTHRHRIRDIVEDAQAPLDKLISHRLSTLQLNPTCDEAPRRVEGINEESLDVLSDVVIVLLLTSKDEVKSTHMLELFDCNVPATVLVLCRCFCSSNNNNNGLCGRLVGLLRGLTSWTVYQWTKTASSTGPRKSRMIPSNAPMKAHDGTFRHHVGVVLDTIITDTSFFEVLCRRADNLSVKQPGGETVLRETLLFVENLFMFTDQHVTQLRKHLMVVGFVDIFIGDQLLWLLSQCSGGDGDIHLLILCARVTATICFLNVTQQEGIRANEALLSALSNLPSSLLVASLPTDGSDDDERTAAAELVAQIVRLNVNCRLSTPCVTSVLRLWSSLSDAAHAAVALRLSNPMNRRMPLDIQSRSYEEMRRIFVMQKNNSEAPVLGRNTTQAMGERRRADHRVVGVGPRRSDVERHPHRNHNHNRNYPHHHHQPRRGQRSRSRRRHGNNRRRPHHHRNHHHHRPRPTRYAEIQRRRDKPNYVHLADADCYTVTSALCVPPESDDVLALLSDDEESVEYFERSAGSSSSSTGSTDLEEVASSAVEPPSAEDDTSGRPAYSLAHWRVNAPPRGVPLRYICALSYRLIDSQPMMSPQGYVFDRDTIARYFRETGRFLCPISGEPLRPEDLVLDTSLLYELQKLHRNFLPQEES